MSDNNIEKNKENIKSYDDFYELISEENWEESKNRIPPILKDFQYDSDGNLIEFMQNRTVKPEHIKFNYSSKEEYEEYVKEMTYCYTHPLYTMKNYFKIIHQDHGKIPFNLYDYQIEFIRRSLRRKRLIAKWPRQTGKCQCFQCVIRIIKIPSRNIFKKIIYNIINFIFPNFFNSIKK